MPFRTHGVGDPRTAGSLLQIAGLAQVPTPTGLAPKWGTKSPSQSLACTKVGGRWGVPESPGHGAGRAQRWWQATLTCVRRTGLLRRSTRRCLPGAGARGRAAPRPAGRPCCARRPPRTARRRRRPQPAVPARPRRQPPRTRGARFPARRREGGRGAGARVPGLARPRGAAPRPLRRGCQPGRSSGGGGRAPPPGGPPGAHLSPAPFAA